MKKFALLTILALLGFGSMSAQKGNRRPQMSVEKRVERLKKELNLTDDQVKQVTTLYTDFQKKMQSAEKGSREQMCAERDKLNKQVEAVLTDEQKKSFKKMQTQRQQGQRGQWQGQRRDRNEE